jgi:hypothetical protein
MKERVWQILLFSGLGLLLLIELISCEPSIAAYMPTALPTASAAIRGIVLGAQGEPLGDIEVRIQATENMAFSIADGSFVLTGLPRGESVTVSAWSGGYYCAAAQQVTVPASGVTLNMRLVQTDDNPEYKWISPTGENSCYSCKPGVTEVWLENDAHGRSAANPRYLSMYNGTDLQGNQSPRTFYRTSVDYGRVPLAPDPEQPYYGPGYLLDFPNTAGNCAACHNPGAAVDAPYTTNPNQVSGADEYGIHCDYCHKIADVILDPSTGLPYPNMPGVLSQDIRRPFAEDDSRYQLFFGSFKDDNVPMEDTYLPLIQQSQFCAPCHYGIFWDTRVYNSFGEWLESSYSDPLSGKTCQNCHMSTPTVLDDTIITNVAPGKGGVERNPLTIAAHDFPGGGSESLLQNAVSMSVQAERQAARVTVSVTIVNDQTGHHVPTDSPLREVILMVTARGMAGTELTLLDGPVLPEWAGVGDPYDGYYAGLPGMEFARILEELWTGVVPSGAYWNPTRVVSDTRLAAGESISSTYVFTGARQEEITVEAQLLYRRAFIKLMDLKGWDVTDILMESQTIVLDEE